LKQTEWKDNQWVISALFLMDNASGAFHTNQAAENCADMEKNLINQPGFLKTNVATINIYA
jgi:hypothetical protein